MEEKEKKKFRFRLTIGNKILGSFIILIALFILVVSIIFANGNTIDNVVRSSKDIYRPSKDAINEFILLVTRSRMLVTNWVYLQTTDSEDKKALRELQDSDYPAVRKQIENLKRNWDIDQKLRMDTVFNHFDSLLQIERESIMANLQSFENYEDPTIKFMAEMSIESEVIPLTNQIIYKLNVIARIQNEITEKSDQAVIDSIDRLKTLTLILGGIFLAVAIISGVYLVLSITKPVAFLKNIVDKLGRGELVEEKQARFNNDEIGDMALAMDNLVNGLKGTTLFAENIGNGNYNTDFKPLSTHDVLGNALINMRNNLSKVAEDDKKRNWATEGLAKFGEILRTNNNDLIKLSDEIISNIVKYLKANQGALYIIDDELDGDEATMSMKACYAWDKKKFLNQKIYRGEGLAGQAWQEKDTVYLTEVPQSYVKINAKTQRLLEESQEMTEQMRAQEEEMRQNMEELQATQEEMQRSTSETESTMLAVHGTLAVAEFGLDGIMTKANGNFLEIYGYAQEEVLGEHHRILATKEEKNSEEYKQFWRDLINGYPKKGEYKRIDRKGEVITVYSNFSPIKNRSGEVVKVMEITYRKK